MHSAALWELYCELQGYVGWTDEDERHLQRLHRDVAPAIADIIDDFYDELRRHPAAMKTITGGDAQIAALKQTLKRWLEELFRGPYDERFVAQRFRVGHRHVEIGLAPYFVNAALSRIRAKLAEAAYARSTLEAHELDAAVTSLYRLLDLDLAIIEFAYQTEFNAREQRVERLATIGQISAGIAHELRNPLNAIKTSVYYLLNARQPTPEKQREHLARIDRQVELSDRVITTLSDFARMPQPKLEWLDLQDFMVQVVTANPIPQSVKVSVECSGAYSKIEADPSQLQIVISNLVRNAVDAMPEGGSLTVKARAGTSDPKRGETIVIDVSDTGIGIPASIIHQVMEPLFSTKSRGLGLGLALSRTILEKHCGHLSVASTPGVGTTFSVALLGRHDPDNKSQNTDHTR